MSEIRFSEKPLKPCDYRRPDCSDQGFLVQGKWHCIFHNSVTAIIAELEKAQ
jgi:hypothetical protein